MFLWRIQWSSETQFAEVFSPVWDVKMTFQCVEHGQSGFFLLLFLFFFKIQTTLWNTACPTIPLLMNGINMMSYSARLCHAGTRMLVLQSLHGDKITLERTSETSLMKVLLHGSLDTVAGPFWLSILDVSILCRLPSPQGQHKKEPSSTGWCLW